MKGSLSSSQLRISALWAFSEAFLGGILHGFHVPFTGLVLSAFAAVCMCALAMKNFSPGKILHATLLVMIVKLTLSPHTPFTAYFAVMLQGLFGELLFGVKTPYRIAAYLVAVFGLMQSAFQKLIVLTVLFGVEGWKALDEFLNSVLVSFGSTDTRYSQYIIMIYLLLHFIAGLAAGRFASLLPELPAMQQERETTPGLQHQAINKTKGKKSVVYWILFILFSIVIYKMYADESFLSAITSKPAKLIFRSTVIIVFWYFFLSPILMSVLKKWLLNKKSAFASEVENILLLLPEMKSMVLYAWMISAKHHGFKRISYFIRTSFRLLLSSR
jgi:hypothetical protein